MIDNAGDVPILNFASSKSSHFFAAFCYIPLRQISAQPNKVRYWRSCDEHLHLRYSVGPVSA